MNAVQTKTEPNPAHVFLIGRPEGFIAYFRDPRATSIVNVQRFELAGPIFDSTESVVSRVGEYRKFKDNSGLTLDDTSDEVARLLRSNSWLCASMTNLQLGNLIIANADSYETKLRDTSGNGVYEVRDLLFQEQLSRNKETHDRPDGNHDLYARLLEKIAVKYAGKLESNGDFLVGSEDDATVDRNPDNPSEGRIRFLVADLLNFSGIAYLNPGDYGNTRYQFSPNWLHQHLVERYNRRIKTTLGQRGCKL